MNVVAAQVAGVASVAVASPPQAEHGGRVHPTILAAAGLLGVEEVYAMGGAGADRRLRVRRARDRPRAGGRRHRPRQRVRRGREAPRARRRGHRRRGRAHRDPRDRRRAADAALVAADLISQAEHDELASAVLVTDSAELADARAPRVASAAASTPHAERVDRSRRRASPRSCWSTTSRPRRAFSNAYGPEHLELHTADDDATLALVRTRARSSSAPTRRSASATTSPAPTTCCRPGARPGSRPGSVPPRSCGRSR